MHQVHRLVPAAVLPLALCVAAAGCGDTADSLRDEAAPVAFQPTRRDFKPHITGPQLVRIERIGGDMGTHDIVRVGRNGSATVVKAYGGGGFLAQRCTLDARDLAALRREVRALPLRGRIIRRPVKHDGMYVPKPSFIVDYGRDLDTFPLSAMPADAAPFVRHLLRMITGREGRCTRTFEQRR